MLEKLKEEVYKANLLLPRYGLVVFTWGNVWVLTGKRACLSLNRPGLSTIP